MKNGRKVVAALMTTVLLCALLTTGVFAAENDRLWVDAQQANGTTALVMTNAVVTDGLIKITYDSSKLTYQSVEVTSEYVAMHAVNAKEAGVILFSWVAPEAYEQPEAAICLAKFHFSGKTDADFILTGEANDTQGNPVKIHTLADTDALEAAIAEAKALHKEDYTAESYAALEKAVANGEKILQHMLALQDEVDDAQKAIRDAIAALVKQTGSESDSTNPSQESQRPTQEGQKPQEPGNSSTGDESHVMRMVLLGTFCAAGVVILLVQMQTKKGWCAE